MEHSRRRYPRYGEFLLHSSANPLTPADLHGGAQLVERAVEQMSLPIDNLLDLATIEAGRLQLVVATVEVLPTVDKALETLRPLAQSRRLQLVTEVDPGLWMRADANRFYQMLSNLIGNAVKFTPLGGQIALRAVASDDFVKFTIDDTGAGIPPRDDPEIIHALRTDGAGGRAPRNRARPVRGEGHRGSARWQDQRSKYSRRWRHVHLHVAARATRARPARSPGGGSAGASLS